MNSLQEGFNGTDDREPVLSAENNNQIKPLKTIWIFIFLTCISTIITIAGIFLSALTTEEKRCLSYFIMLYVRAVFWIITWLIDHYVRYRHEQHRLYGYHEFHKNTKLLHKLPFHIVSLWNVVILTIAAIMQHYYGEHFQEHCLVKFFSPIVYITIFSLIETIILFGVNVTYMVRVKKFNDCAQPPDALRGNYISSGSVGLVQTGSNVDELLEKQADLISYLKEHNTKLNQKLMHLNAQMRHVRI